MSRGGLIWTLVAFALVAASAEPLRAQQVAEVTVQGAPPTVKVGVREDVLAAAYDRTGNIVTVSFTWEVADPSVLRIEEEPGVPGLAHITGLKAGTTDVTVKAGTHSAKFTVQVEGGIPGVVAGTGPAAVLEFPMDKLYLYPGEDTQLIPKFLRADGQPAAPVSVTWESLRPDVATVDQSGKVVGIANGTGLIQATASGLPARRLQVQVGVATWGFARPFVSLAPTESDSVSVIVPTQSRRRLDPRGLTWKTVNPNVAIATPLGAVVAVAEGKTDLVVSGYGQLDSLPVTVHRPVAELRTRALAGDTITIPLGGSAEFHAWPMAADGTPVPDAPVLWQSGDTAIVEYSSADSAAHGTKIGTTTLTVQGPKAIPPRIWTIRVVAAGLAVTPRRVALSPGRGDTLTASYADASGVPLAPATQVAWTTSDSGVATVDAHGAVTAVSAGRAYVVATTPWGNVDSTTVLVEGELLVVSSRSGVSNIYSLDRETYTHLNPVIESPYRDYSPAYAPDGTRIAFVSDRDGNAELYVADADGQDVHRLTTTAAMEDSPVWTPNGRKIVYTSNAGATMQIWIMSADGSDQRQLTQGPGMNQGPSISPDGHTIAFSSTRDGNYEIYLMATDGSNPRNITQSPGNELAPKWMGDSAVAFIQEQRTGNTVRGRTVVRMSPARGPIETVSPPGLFVSYFAVSAQGDLLAAVVEAPGPSGDSVFRLFLLPVGGGTPLEVPRQGEEDQLVTPAFRP